ncbi:MAG: hypothetical protein ACRD2O_02975 [Terriglobia bacterium]
MLTFRNTIQGCREGDAAAWRTLIVQYTPILTGTVKAYSADAGRVERAWRSVLSASADHEFAALKELDAQSDREFFMVLRSSLLEQMARGLEDGSHPGGWNIPEALETLSRLMTEFPLVHQNVAFLSLTGYPEPVIEGIIRISPGIAKSSVDRLNSEFYADFRRSVDAAEWQRGWLRLVSQIRAIQTPDCVPIRRLIRILDGQFGWSEKEPIERHLAVCLHCLEAWVGLQEITYWMRRGTPLAPEQVDELVSSLPLKTKSKQRTSFFKRAFR